MRTTMAFALLFLALIMVKVFPETETPITWIAVGISWAMLFLGWGGEAVEEENDNTKL